jgi:GntR family transcriptional repressor for pyruvate dehydrogenase complex
MKIRLTPIRPKRISDQVFDQLRDLIINGKFKPGEKIMTERELAEELNVSRNSVREALNKLVALKYLEQRQGQGTFIRSIDEAIKIPFATVMEARDASVVDLLEMRQGIECNSASLAAQRADEGDLKTLEKAIWEMEAETKAGGLGTDGDVAFHLAIAAATKNPMQVYIMKNVWEFLHEGIRENLLHLYQEPENIVEILKQHQTIYQTIRQKHPRRAIEAMRNHINFVIEFFKHRQ